MAIRPPRASRAKKGQPALVHATPVGATATTTNSIDSAAPAVDSEQRRGMIAEAAYYRAEQRGFAPGHELDDWCAAEIEVDAVLTQASRRSTVAPDEICSPGEHQ